MHGSIRGPGLDAADTQISRAHTHEELQSIKDDADRLEDELRKLRQARNDTNADPRRSDGPSVEEIDALQIQANAARVLECEATKASMPELRRLDAIQAELVTRTQLLSPDVLGRGHEERMSHALRDRTRRPRRCALCSAKKQSERASRARHRGPVPLIAQAS